MNTMQRFGRHIVFFAILGSVLPVFGRNYLIMRNGTEMDAVSIRYRESTREFIVNTERGSVPIAENQVSEVHVTQPEQWNQGLQLMQAKRFDDAVSVFRNIVRDYQRLNWDLRARGMLAQAYAGQNQHARAIATYEELFREITPSSQQRRAYWQSLLAAEQFAPLRGELDKVIAEGAMQDAAAAYLHRGKLHQAEGNTMDALFDYLRTHLLFQNMDNAELHSEALHLAAQRLDDLRDPRAEEMRTRLRQRYPNSTFARQGR